MKHRLILAACAALVFTVASCDQLGNKAPTPAETNAAFEAFVQAAARKSALRPLVVRLSLYPAYLCLMRYSPSSG